MPNTATTNFPTGLDSPQANPSSVDRSDAAMLAVQTKLGIDGSVDTSSMDYRLRILEASVSGATRKRHVRKSANYTAVANDFVECNSTSAGFTVTLPPLSAATAGDEVSVQLFLGSNAITVDGNGSDTINGALTQTLNIVKEQYNFIANSDLTDWIMC